MAFPSDPLDAVVELALGTWRDVTEDVLVRDRIRIDRGYTAQSRSADPAECALTFRNDGTYTPLNPTSPYYGPLGENTPMRVSVRVLRDVFDRTVASGWGSVDGLAWSTRGAGGAVLASDWNVSGGAATHSVPATVAYRESYLATTSYELVDLAVSFTLPGISSVTGGAVEPANLLLRGLGPGDYYMARVTITTAQAFTVALYRQDGTVVANPVTVPGLTYANSGKYRVRVQAEGWALRAKVWDVTGLTDEQVAASEPYDWHNTVATNWITGPGYVGVRTGVAGGNTNAKPITFSYTDVEVRLPRFAGEVVEWPPEWDISGNDVWSRVKATGIMRRLGQGSSPVQDPLLRYLPTTSPLAYWPLDAGVLATAGQNMVDGTALKLFPGTLGHPTPPWTQGDLGPWLGTGWASPRNGYLEGPVTLTGFTTTWSMDFIRKGVGPNSVIVPDDSVAGSWVIDCVSPTLELVISAAGGGGAVVGAPQLFDAASHHVRWTLTQSGANVAYAAWIDGVSVASGSFAGQTLRAPTRIFVTANGLAGPAAVGHVVMWTSPPALATAHAAASGRPGEPAVERLQRLCAETGIPFSYIGLPAESEPMGPQRRARLLDLLAEAAAADGGLLYEPCSIAGLVYRTRTALYNSSVRLALDYSDGHIAPGFRPSTNSNRIRNDVTVTRTDGGSARSEVTTGPLSVSDPPDGAGRYDDAVTLNVETDEQLPHIAGWLTHLGTWSGARYEKVPVAAARTPSLIPTLTAVDVGGRSTIVNLPPHQPPGPVDQLVVGYAETLDSFGWNFGLTEQPAGPYDVFELEHDTLGRLHTAGSELAADATSSATSLSVATTAGPVWGTQTPYDIAIGGERMTVTAVAGSTSPQTMTVVRSVNGVVKAHDAGDDVALFSRHAVRR